mgnify:CR=1 FL=1
MGLVESTHQGRPEISGVGCWVGCRYRAGFFNFYFFLSFVLAHGHVFRPLWASDFYEGHPAVLEFGGSVRFSLERVLRNSLSLRQSSR